MKTFLSIACLAVLTACGGPAVKKVTLEATDQMKFTGAGGAKHSGMISMRVGETLELTLKNVGKMAKATMGHNFVLLKPGSDSNVFGAAAVAAKDTDHIPADKKDMIIANTKLLGPGESDTLTFKPTEAGDYPYMCSFPGHFAMMKGTVRVK